MQMGVVKFGEGRHAKHSQGPLYFIFNQFEHPNDGCFESAEFDDVEKPARPAGMATAKVCSRRPIVPPRRKCWAAA
jgi:hypothetical protein